MIGTGRFARDIAATVDIRTAVSRALTPHVALGRVIMLVNPLSGGVGPNAASEAAGIFADYALEAAIIALEGGQFDVQVQQALDAGPDALFVLAGDGTVAVSIEIQHGAHRQVVGPWLGTHDDKTMAGQTTHHAQVGVGVAKDVGEAQQQRVTTITHRTDHGAADNAKRDRDIDDAVGDAHHHTIAEARP